MDSSYRGPVTRKMFPFDDIILLCVFTLGTETFSGYVRYRNEQCHLSHDRELIFVTSVKNVPKCLTLHAWNTFGRFYVRNSSSFSLIPGP